MPGHSYRAAEYEAIVRDVLGDVSLGADRIAAVVEATRGRSPTAWRSPASAGSGTPPWRATGPTGTCRLSRRRWRRSTQEAEARDRQPAPELSAAEVVAYLRDLPRLFDEAPDSRRGLTESLFERVEVLGLRRMHLEPTPAAVAAGLVEAFSSASAGYGQGERTWPRGT